MKKAGPAVYERYGDTVAMQRTNREIMRFSRSRTSSRAGGDSGLMDVSFGGGTPYSTGCGIKNKPDRAISQNNFYASARTDLADYWHDQDVALRAIMTGTVKVGKLERSRDPR